MAISPLRIVQYFNLQIANSQGNLISTFHRFQNYFINETKTFGGLQYSFAPFRMEGTSANLGGDNPIVQVLFPNNEVAVKLVEQANGNRLSSLILTTVWLNANLNPTLTYEERYVGVGASFSETTIELRFRSAMDSVGAQFPARTLTRSLVGILPLSADVSLQ